MGIGMSGLVSGLDTDTIVQALVSGYTKKKEDYQKAQTRVEWKMDAWKSLNTKVYSFYSNSLSNLRFSSNYIKKKTTISDASVAKVTASNSSVNGTQSLAVQQLAKAGYLTGGKLNASKGSLTKSDTLAELGIQNGSTIVVGSGNSETAITVNSDTTISDFVRQLNSAGVTANFDEANQRFFISSKKSGATNDFTLMASNANGADALKSLGLASSEISSKELASYQKWANFDNAQFANEVTKEYNARLNAAVASLKSSLPNAVKKMQSENTTIYQADYLDSLQSRLASAQNLTSDEDVAAWIKGEKDFLTAQLDNATLTDDDKEIVKAQLSALNSVNLSGKDQADAVAEIQKAAEVLGKNITLENGNTRAQQVAANNAKINTWNAALEDEDQLKALANAGVPDAGVKALTQTDVENELKARRETAQNFMKQYHYQLQSDYESKSNHTAEETAAYNASKADARYATILTDYASKDALVAATGGKDLLGVPDDGTGEGATRVLGQNAVIYLNGAKFENEDNTMTINGLTISATETTVNDDGSLRTVSITTADDTDAIYDMIRDMFSEYNSIINEMDSLYNASSSKGYDPLTDEQKEAMSESEIEKWEAKIKDSILKGDSTLNSVAQAMKSVMMQGFTVNGKKMYLSNFGIGTQSYFTAADNQKSALHIDGDEEDSVSSGKEDKLRTMIMTDPDSVVSFFTQLSDALYDTLSKKMQTTSLSSTYTLYNDKQMQSEYSSYTTKISEQEKTISTWENYYYQQFTAMEKMLSKLNSQQSALAGLLGN